MNVATLETAAPVDVDAPSSAPTCGACGTVTAPDGVCLELGACELADNAAVRGAARGYRGRARRRARYREVRRRAGRVEWRGWRRLIRGHRLDSSGAGNGAAF